MTDNNHPITPPPELFAQWEDDILESRDNVDYVLYCAWRNGFQAGADQELEACVEWLGDAPVVYNDNGDLHPGSYLRDARRSKPPSLKAQALNELRVIRKTFEHQGLGSKTPALDAALERLGELEQLDD
jgi:hypothetical protein